MESIITSYRQATNRLLFLDYDGTLVDIAATPEGAIPTDRMVRVLSALTADKRNHVVVISGRDRTALEGFLGRFDIGLAAEHGFFIKKQGGQWETTDANMDWRPAILALFQEAMHGLPGSRIDEKQIALAWHYRQADPADAATAREQLLTKLEPLTVSLGLSILTGRKVIEVKPAGTDKGTAAKRWLDNGQFDFILAAGDDVTDEHLFAAMPRGAYTIKIGQMQTEATTILPDPSSLLGLLEDCTRA